MNNVNKTLWCALKYNKIKAPTKYKKHSDSAYLLILFKESIFFI